MNASLVSHCLPSIFNLNWEGWLKMNCKLVLPGPPSCPSSFLLLLLGPGQQGDRQIECLIGLPLIATSSPSSCLLLSLGSQGPLPREAFFPSCLVFPSLYFLCLVLACFWLAWFAKFLLAFCLFTSQVGSLCLCKWPFPCRVDAFGIGLSTCL